MTLAPQRKLPAGPALLGNISFSGDLLLEGSALINTQLQLGGWAGRCLATVLTVLAGPPTTGVCAITESDSRNETAEAVEAARCVPHTQLKLGVNETSPF